MTRTTWYFTVGAVWAAPHCNVVIANIFAFLYVAAALWSWHRERTHREVVHV